MGVGPAEGRSLLHLRLSLVLLAPSDLPALENRVRLEAREPSGVAWREGMPGWCRHCEPGTH